MVEEPFLPLENDPGFNQFKGHNQEPAQKVEDNQNDVLNPCVLSRPVPQLISWLPRAGIDIVEASLVWILWIFGSDLQAAGHKFIGYGLNCLGVIVFFLLAAQVAFREWQKRVLIWYAFAVASLVPVVIYASLAVGILLEAKPHLKLTLINTNSPSADLDFTNEYLFGNSEPAFISSNARGKLIIPLPIGQTNTGLRFCMINDSQVECENAEVIFLLSAQLQWQGDLEWHILRRGEDGRGGLVYRMPVALHPKEGQILPLIDFSDTLGKTEFVTVIMQAKGMETVRLVFWVGAGHLGELTNPFLVESSNGITTIGFPMQTPANK